MANSKILNISSPRNIAKYGRLRRAPPNTEFSIFVCKKTECSISKTNTLKIMIQSDETRKCGFRFLELFATKTKGVFVAPYRVGRLYPAVGLVVSLASLRPGRGGWWPFEDMSMMIKKMVL